MQYGHEKSPLRPIRKFMHTNMASPRTPFRVKSPMTTFFCELKACSAAEKGKTERISWPYGRTVAPIMSN